MGVSECDCEAQLYRYSSCDFFFFFFLPELAVKKLRQNDESRTGQRTDRTALDGTSGQQVRVQLASARSFGMALPNSTAAATTSSTDTMTLIT
jgi:hypothetical protein